jgi:hypothetical protein
VSEFWERNIVIGGCYIFDQEKNNEEYFKALGYDGSSTEFSMHDYK